MKGAINRSFCIEPDVRRRKGSVKTVCSLQHDNDNPKREVGNLQRPQSTQEWKETTASWDENANSEAKGLKKKQEREKVGECKLVCRKYMLWVTILQSQTLYFVLFTCIKDRHTSVVESQVARSVFSCLNFALLPALVCRRYMEGSRQKCLAPSIPPSISKLREIL